MHHYTPAQWVAIDAANQLGYDKEFYDVRLSIGKEVVNFIKAKGIDAAVKHYKGNALFVKACVAIQDILDGKPTGHIIGKDANSSGPQILSTMLRCTTGMQNTGVLNTNRVPSLYTIIGENFATEATRAEIKTATVPFVYGSDAVPDEVFGEDVPAFMDAYEQTAPNAYWARSVLVNAWNPHALAHEFELPDGFIAYLEVRKLKDTKGNFKDFTYTYRSTVNAPVKKERSLAANVTHAWDAFMYRELQRRCNYDDIKVRKAIKAIRHHLSHGSEIRNDKLVNLNILTAEHNFASLEAVEHIKKGELAQCTDKYLKRILKLFKELTGYVSFQMFGIHDEFKCSPVNMNQMSKWYNRILADSYACSWLINTINKLTSQDYELQDEFDQKIYDQILEADYAIH